MQCDCSFEFADMPEVVTVAMHKARKAHTCCECREEIAPGSRYERAQGKWCGVWQTFKTCEPCIAIRADYCPDGYVFGGLGWLLDECLGFNPLSDPESWEKES